ncbi:MAG TPA: hypothetical protein VFQ85_01985 [Mycobacteriales bacterium]|jgi:hypothetical protein|nr:hypothetical protein [Mycobacteriales bacterium]
MKRLTLKVERLAELDADELHEVAGGTYTGAPGCIVSYQPPCLSVLCSFVDCIKTR